MGTLIERGVSRGDCCDKIAKKYGPWFSIIRENPNCRSGFFGLFSREKYEVEFSISPQLGSSAGASPAAAAAAYSQTKGSFPQQKYSKPLSGEKNLGFAEEKKRVLAAAGKDPDQLIQKAQKQEEKETTGQEILAKLKEIQEKMDISPVQKTEHPSFARITKILKLNDFSDDYINGLLDKARRELPLEILEDFNKVQNQFLKWIGESITIFNTSQKEKSGRILALIGPTGVGKTTTIAKLAAAYGINSLGYSILDIQMITIDAYKIGAKEQLKNYGNIMEIPVEIVDNYEDLNREITLHKDHKDLILIDTIGRSPRDSKSLGEMNEILEACTPKAEIHLALSASTKASDMEHILQQFEPFEYQAVILTKFDETRHIGNIISSLSGKNKPISYITHGQKVPGDIKKANIISFLINLEDFRVDREEIERLFPSGKVNQFQRGQKKND